MEGSKEETIMVDVDSENYVINVNEIRKVLPTVENKELQRALRQLMKQADEEDTTPGMYIACKLGLAKQGLWGLAAAGAES